MRAKTLLVLLLAAGLLVVLAWLRLGGGERSEGTRMGAPLFDDLPVNQIAAVTIADADHQTTLTRGETVWQVDARGGYPADFDTLRDTVVKLSRLKVGRSFAGSPESLERLALMPPTAENAAARGKQITLKDAAGEVLADVVLGQTRQTDDGGIGGQYLKMAKGATVFLVDGNFRFLKTAPSDWLDNEILDIKPAEVAMVTCYRGAGDTVAYQLARPEKGQPAEMRPVPQGRTVDAAKADQVLDALAPLSLDDVTPADEPPAAEGARLVYRLYDGREITLWPSADGEARYTLRVAAREVDPLEPAADAAPANDANSSDETSKEAPAALADQSQPSPKTAQALHEALSPWTFTIKKWQFDSLITQPEALLEAVRTE